MDPRLVKRQEGASAYYTIYWSPLKKADKYLIAKGVPAMPGFFELYYKDRISERLRLFYYARVWMGGLRSALRTATDPVLIMGNAAHKNMLRTHDCYFRYFLCPSRDDMDDVLYFFTRSDAPRRPGVQYGLLMPPSSPGDGPDQAGPAGGFRSPGEGAAVSLLQDAGPAPGVLHDNAGAMEDFRILASSGRYHQIFLKEFDTEVS